MPLAWTLGAHAPEDELKVIAEGVFSHGRAQACDGNAEPIACLVLDGPRVVAGGTGRTEYRRLFVSHLWVTEDLRRQGLARRTLQALESEAIHRGCSDALIETLDDGVAAVYGRLGYRSVAVVTGYVGPFNRHILLKLLNPPAIEPWT
jgi:GNAT superfamily N-acetyltransferase